MVVVDDVSQVVSAAVVGFAHAHGVVSEVHIAVVALGEVSLAGDVGGGLVGRTWETYKRVQRVSVLLRGSCGQGGLIFRHLDCSF